MASWVADNLDNAFETWNEKVAELWQLVSETPETFKGGHIWTVIEGINHSLQAIGLGLLVVFFALSLARGTLNFADLKRPEQALKYFLRFCLAKAAVTYGMSLMTTIFSICGGVVSAIAEQMGGMTASITLPDEMRDIINGLGFFESIPLWFVTLLGSLFITVLSFILVLTVYSRFFKLYIYCALSPIPLASFAGEGTSSTGHAFLKSYIGVCMEGAVIVLACVIFAAFSSSGPPVLDPTAEPVSMTWQYIGEVIFNMLVLVGLVKGGEHLVREMMGA